MAIFESRLGGDILAPLAAMASSIEHRRRRRCWAAIAPTLMALHLAGEWRQSRCDEIVASAGIGAKFAHAAMYRDRRYFHNADRRRRRIGDRASDFGQVAITH